MSAIYTSMAPSEGVSPPQIDLIDRRQGRQVVLERLRTHADRTHELLMQSRELLANGSGQCTIPPAVPPTDLESVEPSADERREALARQRLLEWEAEELTRVVPGEMGTPQRRFAISLYEAIAESQGLGMSRDRLLFHVRAALERYLRGE
jgi:hypothetical protein